MKMSLFKEREREMKMSLSKFLFFFLFSVCFFFFISWGFSKFYGELFFITHAKIKTTNIKNPKINKKRKI